MIRRSICLAGITALTVAGGATTATAAPFPTPKTGVFGSPANPKCLSANYTHRSCRSAVRVFDFGTGTVQAQLFFSTGCKAIDDYLQTSPLNIKRGTARAPKYSGNVDSDGEIVALTYTAKVVWSTPKKARITFRAGVDQKGICKPNQLRTKAVTVKWFSKTDNGG